MKKVLCIFHGIFRTFKHCYLNILNNLILINEKNYEFTFIVNTQSIEPHEIEFLENNLNINNHKLKEIIVLNIDNSIKYSSTYIYALRIYQCLKKEENNHYDMYINLRFDITLNKPIILDNYCNKYCIITGTHTRDCSFHNRDWDLMSIGDNLNYKRYMYLCLNNMLLWYTNEFKPLEDKYVFWNININDILTYEELENINKLTGLVSNSHIEILSKIIKNLLSLGGNFVLSENYENIFAKLVRNQN